MKKNLFSAAIIVAILSSILALPVHAADVTAGVDFNSAYVWRGQTFNDGAVIQPSVDVSKNGFGFNLWGNFDLDDYNKTLDDYQFSELDMTLSYTHTVGIADLGIGLIEYIFPTNNSASSNGTREYFLNLGLNLPLGFSIGLTYYYDFDETKDFYSVLGVGYDYEFTPKISLSLGSTIAYAGDKYCKDGKKGFYDYTVSGSLGYALMEDLSVSLNLNYVGSADSDKLADLNQGGKYDVEVFGGVGISYTF